MKYQAIIFALFTAIGARAQDTNNLDFRFPIRSVENQRVDLRYLFAHWRSSTGAVTNTHWIHLTGSIIDDSPSGWVVDGKTESASGLDFHQKVLVVNPPRFEKQTLDALLAQKEKIENGSAAGSSDNSQQNGNPQRPRHHHHTGTNDTSNAQDGSSAVDQGTGVQSPTSRLDKELAAIPTMNTSTGAVYSVNFFVFYTGQSRSGMPLVDFGIPTH